jgi:hypothetical protein
LTLISELITTMRSTVIERDMTVRTDILRTNPKKLPPNINFAVSVDAERFTEHFTKRIIGEE